MNRRRKSLAIAIAAALVTTLATATAVVAAGRHAKTGFVTKAADAQVLLWRTGKGNRAFTTSTKWQELELPAGGCIVGEDSCRGFAEPRPFMVWAEGPMSLTFSGMFSRAPVELRLRDGGHYMRPGRVNFAPRRGSNAFSFTFVSPRKGRRACQGPILEWRSPTGQEVRLNKATIVVHYKTYRRDDSARCL